MPRGPPRRRLGGLFAPVRNSSRPRGESSIRRPRTNSPLSQRDLAASWPPGFREFPDRISLHRSLGRPALRAGYDPIGERASFHLPKGRLKHRARLSGRIISGSADLRIAVLPHAVERPSRAVVLTVG